MTPMSIGLPVQLVRLSGHHVRDLQALAGDEAISGALEGVRDFVERAQRLRARGSHATFAVCEADQVLGVVSLAREPMAPDRAELGYWIGRPYRGRGYATAAVARVLTHGFGRMALTLVFARTLGTNRASARVLERLAFRFVGLEAARDPGRPPQEPVRRYELTREEWRRHPAGKRRVRGYFFVDS